MNYKLIIIDDDEQFRTTLCNCFPWDNFGFVLTAQFSNGQDALSYLENNEVHVILCDIQMPVINGLDMARRLSTKNQNPLLVFISGFRDFDYAYQAIQLGVRYYLLKPLKYEEIVNTFTLIKADLDRSYKVPTYTSSVQSDDFVEKVKLYIENHLENASLSDLSKELFMNSCYISQLFKQKTDQNFSEYLTQIRMKHAGELLATSSEKIYNIAKQVGYSNPKNFARAFHAYYKLSPTEYRLQQYSQSREVENP